MFVAGSAHIKLTPGSARILFDVKGGVRLSVLESSLL